MTEIYKRIPRHKTGGSFFVLIRLTEFLYHKALRSARTGIQKPLVKHVESFVGQGGQKGWQFLTFTVSCRMTRISAEHQDTSRLQKMQRF